MEISFQGFSNTTMEVTFQGFKNNFFKKMHKQGPTGRANLFTSVFGKQIPTDFDYNKQDQTRDPMTCCAFCWCAFIEFVGFLMNGTRPCDIFRQVLRH